MGKPSDKRRSARRPGARDRARVKKFARAQVWAHVGGAGTYHVKAGRKKFNKVRRYCDRVVSAHQSSGSTSKSTEVIKRPLYTITLSPLPSVSQQ